MATAAIAMPPAIPPVIPAEMGGTSIGRWRRLPETAAGLGTRATSGAWGAGAIPLRKDKTLSTFGVGSTARHHPTAPTRVRAAPTMLTAALVTRPAPRKVIPNAAIIGAAVGAG